MYLVEDDQSGEYEENLKEISTENLEKQETIRNNFPRMDIICFQVFSNIIGVQRRLYRINIDCFFTVLSFVDNPAY